MSASVKKKERGPRLHVVPPFGLIRNIQTPYNPMLYENTNINELLKYRFGRHSYFFDEYGEGCQPSTINDS